MVPRRALPASAAPPGFSSMAQDLAAGRRTEIEETFGDLVRRAAALGADVPRAEFVYRLIVGPRAQPERSSGHPATGCRRVARRRPRAEQQQRAGRMKIVEVKTVRVEEYAEFIAVLLRTDSGLTASGRRASARVGRGLCPRVRCPRLLGQDPLTIEKHAKDLPSFYVTHGGTGVSTRAHSAVDIALWDLFGKVCEQPLYQLLGGKVRDSAPIYNTCGGYHYGKAEARHRGTSRPVARGQRPTPSPVRPATGALPGPGGCSCTTPTSWL